MGQCQYLLPTRQAAVSPVFASRVFAYILERSEAHHLAIGDLLGGNTDLRNDLHGLHPHLKSAGLAGLRNFEELALLLHMTLSLSVQPPVMDPIPRRGDTLSQGLTKNESMAGCCFLSWD